MRPESDAEYTSDWGNEETQCAKCNSFEVKEGIGYCHEAKGEVSPTGHCDYFKSQD